MTVEWGRQEKSCELFRQQFSDEREKFCKLKDAFSALQRYERGNVGCRHHICIILFVNFGYGVHRCSLSTRAGRYLSIRLPP